MYRDIGRAIQTEHWGSIRRFFRKCQIHLPIPWLHILRSSGIRNSVLSLTICHGWGFKVCTSTVIVYLAVFDMQIFCIYIVGIHAYFRRYWHFTLMTSLSDTRFTQGLWILITKTYLKLELVGIIDVCTLNGQSWHVLIYISDCQIPNDPKISNHKIKG